LKVKNRLRAGKIKTITVEKSIWIERETALIKTLPGYWARNNPGRSI